MRFERPELPSLNDPLHWLGIEDQYVFPIYKASGWPSGVFVAYAIAHLEPDFDGDLGITPGLHQSGLNRWFTVIYSPEITQEELNAKVQEAVHALRF